MPRRRGVGLRSPSRRSRLSGGPARAHQRRDTIAPMMARVLAVLVVVGLGGVQVGCSGEGEGPQPDAGNSDAAAVAANIQTSAYEAVDIVISTANDTCPPPVTLPQVGCNGWSIRLRLPEYELEWDQNADVDLFAPLTHFESRRRGPGKDTSECPVMTGDQGAIRIWDITPETVELRLAGFDPNLEWVNTDGIYIAHRCDKMGDGI